MNKKHSYRAVGVDNFYLPKVIQCLVLGCIVAIDVAKSKFVAALANTQGQVLALLRFTHPTETLKFLSIVRELQTKCASTTAVMEPTGTYGDALRYQLHELGLPVHMSPPKQTHDYGECMDGVPGMHDPKAATVLAHLHTTRPGRRWTPETLERRDVRAALEDRARFMKMQEPLYGQLEALRARHWPELELYLRIREQVSALHLLRVFGGPTAVKADPAAAAALLRQASHRGLDETRINGVLVCANESLGVPMTERERQRVMALAADVLELDKRIDKVDAELRERTEANECTRHMRSLVGVACAAAIDAFVGPPTDYANPRIWIKAMGMNFKRKQSGNKEGPLQITKRGAPMVRKLLFLAALRLIQKEPLVAAWYRNRTSYQASTKEVSQKLKAVIAVCRKLIKALWHVGQGKAFDPEKLFDVHRLAKQLENAPATRRPQKRTRMSGAPVADPAGAPAPAPSAAPSLAPAT